VDQFGVQAIDRYEQALQEAESDGTNIKALIISNPHNPLGTLGENYLYAPYYTVLMFMSRSMLST
jgi:hypothetical protein